MSLDLAADVVTLTEDLCNIVSVSGSEGPLADRVEQTLRAATHLQVVRYGNNLVARTEQGCAERVVIAGHLDTVPVDDNLPVRRDQQHLHGLGTCDMKGGVAIALRTAATLPTTNRDVTYVFYECEEVEEERNGLKLLGETCPDLLAADFAVLMEPSDGAVEAGCQGTLRVDLTTRGERAHSARAWRGSNAIHAMADVLARLAAYEPRRPVIDGLEYHEGLNAVGISGGVAGNVLPDACTVSINHRFAPDRDGAQALAHVREVFAGYTLWVTDLAESAMPGLEIPAAAAFVEAVGGRVNPKFGWTDVARFGQWGVPAVNYGPGDPHLAHRQDERVPVAQVRSVEQAVRQWLGSGT